MDYKKFYKEFKKELIHLNTTDTGTVTTFIEQNVNDYFKNDNSKFVFYSKANNEFMFDVSVLLFDPNSLVEKENNSLTFIQQLIAPYLVVESELGGNSASGPKPLFENVLFDFCKLLLCNSPYKIFVFTATGYSDENVFLANRLKVLKEMYNNSLCKEEILLVYIEGSHTTGNSRQVKLNIQDRSVKGFLFGVDKLVEL